jgi:hypothetical protein
MKVRLVISVILILVSTTGCQNSVPASALSTSSVASNTPGPTVTSEPLIREKLDCSVLGDFTKCMDEVLGMEFEYPTAWGEIEAVLRPGGYSGYAYDYYYGGKTIAETEPLVAGGRSKDFSEGRGGVSTDFAGYGKSGLQYKKESCDPKWQDLFPICQQVAPHVAWLIRLPNANYICNSAPGFYTTPVFRIEVNFPNSEKINGFVFEAPFLSEQLSNEVESSLYPLLGLDSNMMVYKCSQADQSAFDAQLMLLVEKIKPKQVDTETQRRLDELLHLAASIRFP